MRKFIIALTLTCSLAGTAACAPKPPVLTPAGQAAYTADQVAVRVNELMNAAIASEAKGLLPRNTTRTIVQFCTSADTTLAQAPSGWAATLRTAWTATKANLPPIQNTAIIAAMGAVDVVLGVQ